jgi:hypothetical protein
VIDLRVGNQQVRNHRIIADAFRLQQILQAGLLPFEILDHAAGGAGKHVWLVEVPSGRALGACRLETGHRNLKLAAADAQQLWEALVGSELAA